MEHVAIFGLGSAEPTIQWPERGSAETALCEREGWQRHMIPIVDDGRPTTVDSMCCGELAVNRMLGGEEGFAISLSATGYRISHGGRVFARCGDAMRAAEQMLQVPGNWTWVQTQGFAPEMARGLGAILDAAEQRGEILLDRVYPR